jgi:sarcosine oxidase, subunit gamma
MTGLERKAPLSHRSALTGQGDSAAIAEKPFEGKLILRGTLERIAHKAGAALGTPLPATVHATAFSRGTSVQWLGPDEWLLITAPDAAVALQKELGQALAGEHHQIADVSDYYTTIGLSGTWARDMLMKVATIDFHPRAFKTGMGVTTNFGRAVATLRQTRDDAEPGGAAFDIVVRISMADYLWCLIAEAGREWGLPAQTPKGQVKLHLPHFESGSD